MYPGATVLPSMSTGASDQAQLRAKGIQSVRHRPGVDRSGCAQLPGARRRRAPGRVVALSVREYVWNVVTRSPRESRCGSLTAPPAEGGAV